MRNERQRAGSWCYVAAICIVVARQGMCNNDSSIHPDQLWRDPHLSCGPRCLSFISKLVGSPRPYAEIASQCAVGHEGCSFDDLRRVSECIGLKCRGRKAGLAELSADECPAILHVSGPTDRLHFIVLLSYDEKSADVFDPKGGLLTTDADKLGDIYLGTALVFGKSASPNRWYSLLNAGLTCAASLNGIVIVRLLAKRNVGGTETSV